MTSPDALLTADELATIAELPVLDNAGNSVKFGSLYADQRTVFVFVRHFWCGSCQDYCQELAKVPDEALTRANVRLVIIGCGQPDLINRYKEITGFRYDVFADPSLKVYDMLRAQSNLKMPEKAPSYMTVGLFMNVVRSFWRGPFTTPSLIGKQGPSTQLGGDFILGPGQTCSFAWRMQNTQDHIEVPELMKHAGVDYP